MQTIGDRIRAFRDSRGLTQKDIFRATKEEIKQTTLSAIEKGQAKPGFDTLAALLLAYPQLNADWLMRGIGAMIMGEAPGMSASLPAAPQEPATTYALPPAAPTDAVVQQLIQQLAEERRQHREEAREARRERREDERAAATNTANLLTDMRRQIEDAQAETARVREEKDERIFNLEREVHQLKLQAGLRLPTAEEKRQLEEAARAKDERSAAGFRPAGLALAYSNPDFIRPLEVKVIPLFREQEVKQAA